jgi:hypothetical protein
MMPPSPDVSKWLDGWKLPDPMSKNDMALDGPPLMVRDGRLMDVPERFQSYGRVSVDGDVVTQQTGPGHTAEFSLSQLSAHAKDPEYFANTIRYAADHKDSVKIDMHGGIASVRDPALERSLPQNMPLRDPILHAAVKHNIDPVLLAAVGVQETHLGADYLGKTPDHYKATHRGDVEADSPGGHGYGPFQMDDAKRRGETALPQPYLDRIARDPYFAANEAAQHLAGNLRDAQNAHSANPERDALHLYNAGSMSRESTRTEWGPPVGSLSYEDSALRYRAEIESQVRIEQGHHQDRGLGR